MNLSFESNLYGNDLISFWQLKWIWFHLFHSLYCIYYETIKSSQFNSFTYKATFSFSESHCYLICCSGIHLSTSFTFIYFYLILCTFFYFYRYHHLLLSFWFKNHLQWITLWLGLLQWFWRIPLPVPISSKSQNYLSS